jgi:hypothetical protein
MAAASRVASVRAQLGYIIPMGDVQGYVNVKTYKELESEHRPEGWNVWLTLALTPAQQTSNASMTPTTRQPQHQLFQAH